MNIDFDLLKTQIEQASDLLSTIATESGDTEHENALLGLILLGEAILKENN